MRCIGSTPDLMFVEVNDARPISTDNHFMSCYKSNINRYSYVNMTYDNHDFGSFFHNV